MSRSLSPLPLLVLAAQEEPRRHSRTGDGSSLVARVVAWLGGLGGRILILGGGGEPLYHRRTTYRLDCDVDSAAFHTSGFFALRRREFIASVGGAAVALQWPLGARPMAAGEIRRIGFLRVGLPPPAWIESLRQGLRELGYIEGRDIAIEFRLAASVAELPAFAAELVRLNVDVIVASGTPPVLALAAGDAVGTIPVVFVAAIDPVATGLVASLARPQGNITGLTNTQADITGKQIQLLKELLPNLSSIGILGAHVQSGQSPLFGGG